MDHAAVEVPPDFAFVDPLPLIDEELELVVPSSRWTRELLAACRHPLTRAMEPEIAATHRSAIRQFLQMAPAGRESGEARWGQVPTYHFWMHLRREYDPLVSIAGSISLRVGWGPEIELYYGHIGYGVYPPARGHHYALRACRLLLPLARLHGLSPLWITTDPQNIPSRRTCEQLGGRMVEIVDVPPDHALYARGQVQKCRYRIDSW